jgi:hypothetical protein
VRGWGAGGRLGVLRLRGRRGEGLASKDPTSEEAAVFEVLLDDDVGDSVKDKFDVLCVGSTRHVGIDLLHIASHVELQELHFDVVARILVRVRPYGRRERSLRAAALA